MILAQSQDVVPPARPRYTLWIWSYLEHVG